MKIYFGYAPNLKKHFLWLEREDGHIAAIPLPDPFETDTMADFPEEHEITELIEMISCL